MVVSTSTINQAHKDSWVGIIFEGNDGQVYGNQTLSADLTIPEGKALTVPQNTTLTIPEGVTLTNNGTIYENGTINGKVTGNLPVKITVEYLDDKGVKQTANCNVEITAEYLTQNSNTLSSGWYVVQASETGLTINSRITVNGDVNLILADSCDFTVNGGIQVQDNDHNINTVSTNSLTIYAQSKGDNMGKLTAQKVSNWNAGIGGGGEDPGGNITINGGNVTTKGGEKAAGIGGGWYSNGGTITINGGTVTANGGKDGAGIGGGWYSNGGNITIRGGTVTATGGRGGAGLGGGVNGSGGVITINGGTVNATGNGGGAGIGGGPNTIASVDVDGGNITINGGTVEAEGSSDAAGIGGGYCGDGGTIIINGGTVNATGGENGAGIGGGLHIDSDQIGSGGTITIRGGTVTANGGKDGAGIGGGVNGSGGKITINGGTVNATGNGGGAGIGGGPHTNGRVEVNGGDITISGGTVTATGKYGGAGIGAGNRGTPGTFQTPKEGEADGTAVIYASYISDQSGKYYNSWRGIIFEGNDGQVYGTNVTPAQSFEVPANKNLLIPANTRLTISDGITAANSGKVYMNGGTVSGAFTNTENGGVYYPLTLTNCTANGVTSTYQNKTYAKAGETVTLTPNNADAGKMFTGWQPVGVINEDRSFTMPEKPVSVTAEFADIVASVTVGENTFNFASFQEAFNAANGNTATITLLKDVEISDTLEITGGNVTFQSAVKPDSAVTKEYTITAEGQTDAITVTGGTLNFQSGNIAVNNYAWSIRVNGGTVNITGGTIHTVAAGKGSSLNISGGTIDGLSVDGAKTALSGGSFDSINTSTGTVSALLANGHAYKLLPQSTWVDQTHGNIGQTLTGDIQVLSIPVSIKTQPTGIDFTYGETNKTLSVGANGESISYQWYEVKDGNTSQVTGKTGATYDVSNLNAGSYKYFCRLTCEGYVLDSDTVTVIVKKASNSWTTGPAIEGWTYGENAKAPTYAAKFGTVTVEYSADGTAYRETVPTTAGSYKARFTVAGTDNYGGLSEVKDFTISPREITVKITPGGGTYGGTITGATAEIKETLVGNDQVPVTLTYTGNANDGTKVNSTDVPTKAGTYTVTATIDNPNYSLAETTATFEIGKATVTTPTVESKAYTGKPQTAVVPESDRYTVTSNLGGTDAGNYDVVLTLTDSDNYQWDDKGGKTTFRITQAENSWTEIPAIEGWTYGDKPSTPVGEARFGTVKVEYSASGDNYIEDVPTDAGSYNARFTVAETKNYKGLSEVRSFSIAKRQLTIIWSEETTFTYNGEEQYPTASAGNVAKGDNVTLNISGGTDVGSYTAICKSFTQTGEESTRGNYMGPTEDLEKSFSITAKPLTVKVQVADKQYDGKNTAAFDGTPTLEDVVGNDDVTLVNGTPTFKTVGVGEEIEIVFTNGFSLTGKASGNYTLTQPTDVTASIYNRYTALVGTDFTSNTGSANANGWLNQTLVIRAGEGFQISATNTAEGEWTDKLTVDQDGEGTLTFYVRNTQTGAISQAVTVPYKLDTTKPSAEIKFGTDAVTEKGDPKTLYLSSTIQVTITGTDGTSGIGSVIHCLSAEELNDSQLESAAWVSSSSFQVEAVDTASYRVYTKVVDNAGNVAYFRSNRFIFDTTAPSITGVENGKTYYTTQTVTITDTNLKSLTLNGAAATSPITLKGNMDATHIIEATDKAGNTTTYTVYMKTLDSLVAEDVEDVDASNVSKDNKENLEKAKEDLEDQLASATEAEQGTINELLDPINEALAALKNVEAVEAVIKNLPDSIQIDDEDPADENAIKAARAAYEALTDHEKTLADISKLTKLESDLVAYGIIAGDGSVWNMGSGEDQVFTANGPVRKFQKVELDNEKLDEANYQVTMGSTIVTLNAAFMQTLEEGSHTLAVFYTDGQTKEAKFEVKRSQSYLDLTEEPAFQGRTEVFVDGVSYPIEENGNSYVNLPETGDLLTLYTYRTGAGDYGDYPTGMEVYRINRSAGGTTVTHIPELSNLLQYSGCSIRVTGNQGIRMITSLDQGKKAALTGPGLTGFTLEEYGTVVTWASDLGEGDLNLNSGKHNFAYKRGVADPVFGTNGSLTQYTNVLVGFSLEECSKDIVMRPYIVLRVADGNQYTLYGGTVTRSISYIAWQNRDTYKPWTSAYDYVHDLMGLYNAA